MKLGFYSGCHQLPERSFSIGSYQLPVCSRCIGILTGELIMILYTFIFGNPDIILCLVFIAIMFLDWFLQYLKIILSTNLRRFITGILAGYGLFGVYYYIIQNAIAVLL